MIRASLVFPELGLVRVSNCPMRSKEYVRQARYRRDMQSFNWQLSETVKNIRNYKKKEFNLLLVFKQLMNKFRVYDTYIGDIILSQIKEPYIHRYYNIELTEPNYHLKIQVLFSRLKMLGYSDVKFPAFTDYEIEISFIKSVKYVGPELYEKMRHLYEILSKKGVKYKWKVIASYIKQYSPNAIETCDFINLMYNYKKNELYLGHCLRNANLSIEENNLLVAWWERVKHSNVNNI